ncbi:hypothetical protein GGE06_002141 [Streptomyces sp. SFB5A]|uniref:Uncharacterized protein n=1 Tax=Streptomyces nymphaeiformis TaxID=2663842 RepID=A0A7W7TXM3_9ACTN|nr:hypothetical protein [Streptomyces nymphaeiformis]
MGVGQGCPKVPVRGQRELPRRPWGGGPARGAGHTGGVRLRPYPRTPGPGVKGPGCPGRRYGSESRDRTGGGRSGPGSVTVGASPAALVSAPSSLVGSAGVRRESSSFGRGPRGKGRASTMESTHRDKPGAVRSDRPVTRPARESLPTDPARRAATGGTAHPAPGAAAAPQRAVGNAAFAAAAQRDAPVHGAGCGHAPGEGGLSSRSVVRAGRARCTHSTGGTRGPRRRRTARCSPRGCPRTTCAR